MVFCPRGETFVKSIDSSGAIKSGMYIADVLSTVIQEIGSEHVVQVVKWTMQQTVKMLVK